MLQLVAGEQREIVDQGRQLHCAQARLGVAREVHDVVHDGIQMIHLLAEHPRILAPRIAFVKLQPQRVVQHFHYRERIANLMRHLGREQPQRAKLLVAPQLFLHIHRALVQLRLFDGHGRKLGERAQRFHFFIGEHMRRIRVHV